MTRDPQRLASKGAPSGRPRPGAPRAMTPGEVPSPDDIALFRRAVGKVRGVEDPQPAASSSPPRKVRAKARAAHRPAAAAPSFAIVGAGERLSYLRPGLPGRILRDLRRGRFTVEDELHLRGMRAAEALRAAGDFVRRAQDDGLRCVRIVHGKGRGSADGRPVLKGEIDHWLRRHDAVDAFCSARNAEGGPGALYLLLRRRTGSET